MCEKYTLNHKVKCMKNKIKFQHLKNLFIKKYNNSLINNTMRNYPTA